MSSSNKNKIRKVYSQRTIIEHSNLDELNFYRQLQKFFANVDFLVHFDRDHKLYIDVNVFKQRDFKAIIYHLKSNVDFEKPRRTDIELILFLSRLLNFAKT